jgi:hypothetical protein
MIVGLETHMIWPRAMLLAIVLAIPMSTVQGFPEDPVWFWFTTCGGPALGLELRLDRTIIFKSSFPLCRANRSSISGKANQKRLHFAFKPPRAIVWEGYGDNEGHPTPANQVIDGDIWLAGSDPDELLLGVSFIRSNTIEMNSIHIAHPGRRDQTEMAPSLVLTTYPIKLGKKSLGAGASER